MCIFYTHVKIPPLAFTALLPHFSFYCKPFSRVKPRHCNHHSSKNVAAVTRLTTCDNILVSTYSFERRQSEEKKQRERGEKEENSFSDVKGKSKRLLSEMMKGWFNLGLHMEMQEAQLSFLFLLSIIHQMSSWATVELLHMHTEIMTRSAAKLRN